MGSGVRKWIFRTPFSIVFFDPSADSTMFAVAKTDKLDYPLYAGRPNGWKLPPYILFPEY